MIEDKFTGKVQLAVFESTSKWPYQLIYNESEAAGTDLTQVSEWVEVQFTRLNAQTIIQSKVANIDATINRKTNELMEELSKLKVQRQELLALTFENDFRLNVDPVPFSVTPTAM